MQWKEAFAVTMADSYDIWLSGAVASVAHISLLLDRYGSAQGVFCAGEGIIKSVEGLTPLEYSLLTTPKKEDNRLRLYDFTVKHDVDAIRFDEPRYPKRFLSLSDRPYVVFVQGRPPKPDAPSIAIVGSRRASDYGQSIASFFAAELAKYGITIVSGLAMGIDGISHQAALPYGGRTVGILGSGIGIPYPKENWRLYQEMREKACILSEHGPEVPALKQNFPHRNRLIAAMSDGILVIEAAERSGTLITVDRGLEQGKEIYAIPGRIGDRNSQGCLNLIKQGARLVTHPDEILSDLTAFYPSLARYSAYSSQISLELSNDDDKSDELSKNSENDKLGLADEEKVVYDLCRLDAKHFDLLLEESGLSVGKLSEVLYSLQNRGVVRQSIPNYYCRSAEGMLQ